jgi:hypothetical protein
MAFFIVSLGYNAVFSITQVACLAAVEHSQLAMVTSTISRISSTKTSIMDTNSFTVLSRSLGSTIGITLASVVYQHSLNSGLWARFGDQPNAAEEIQHIRDDLAELHRLPSGWYEGVIKSLMVAFEHVWMLLLAWAVLALVSIAPIKQHKLYSTLERK